jgi:hypothetical protein
MVGAINVVHTWAALFQAEFATPALAWVFLGLVIRLRRAVATLPVRLAVFFNGNAFASRLVTVADRIAVRRWDARSIAHTHTTIFDLFFPKFAAGTAANMLACFDAHKPGLAITAFRVFKRQAGARSSTRTGLAVAVNPADCFVACNSRPTWFARALARFSVASTSARAIFFDTGAPFLGAEVSPIAFCGFRADAFAICAFANV